MKTSTKRGKTERMVPVVPPEVPAADRLAHVIRLLGVRQNPICTLRRVLNGTDAKKEHARLQIVHDEVRCLLECAAVTDAERALMADATNKLPLQAYDRRGNRYDMNFSRVASITTGNGVYRLIGGFAQFLRESKMEEGHTLVMWVFRLPPRMPATAMGPLAMVMLDYRTNDDEEMAALEEVDRRALQDGMAATALLQLAGTVD